jgi:hypothetical protein
MVRMAQALDFNSEFDDWEEDDGEPSSFRAYRRIREALQARRDTQPVDYDPCMDEGVAEFRVADVAMLWAMLRELEHFQGKVMHGLGPPARSMRWNRKLRDFEDWGPADDYGD